MASIPNNSLPFNNDATDGTIVDASEWNQALQVIQAAVNDNQSQINVLLNAQTTVLVGVGTQYPTSPAPSAGQLFYRSDLAQLKIFNNQGAWEDAESVVATANGLAINGVTYDLSTGAIDNTIAVRDGTGSLTAQTFYGNATSATQATTATNADKLGGVAAASYALAANASPSGNTSFTTPGVFTWTVPVGVYRVLATVVGAGGGGGAVYSYSGGVYAFGGGGGGAISGWVNVTPGEEVSISVGAGGVGAIYASTAGTAGGNSSFNNVLTATGGEAGANASGVSGSVGGSWTPPTDPSVLWAQGWNGGNGNQVMASVTGILGSGVVTSTSLNGATFVQFQGNSQGFAIPLNAVGGVGGESWYNGNNADFYYGGGGSAWIGVGGNYGSPASNGANPGGGGGANSSGASGQQGGTGGSGAVYLIW